MSISISLNYPCSATHMSRKRKIMKLLGNEKEYHHSMLIQITAPPP